MIPAIEIMAVSIGVTLASQAVHLFMVNQDYVEKTRAEIKEIHTNLKTMDQSSKDYKDSVNKQLKLNMEMSKHTMKPAMVTMIPYFLMFSVLRARYEGLEVLQLPFSIMGKEYLGWIGTFILVSLILTTIIQKAHKVYRKKQKGENNAKTVSKTNEKSV